MTLATLRPSSTVAAVDFDRSKWSFCPAGSGRLGNHATPAAANTANLCCAALCAAGPPVRLRRASPGLSDLRDMPAPP
jgi:hypothetical protein